MVEKFLPFSLNVIHHQLELCIDNEGLMEYIIKQGGIMSTKTAKINARIDPEHKGEVNSILQELGLSESEAIRVFYRQILHQRGLPFEVKIPNETTKQAIRDIREGKVLTSYDSPEEYFESKDL